VKPIHAPFGSLLRQRFVVQVLGMNEAAEKKYWQDMKVKRGTTPPFELSNTMRAVFSARGAIRIASEKISIQRLQRCCWCFDRIMMDCESNIESGEGAC
jgi:hypothetical protein